MWAYLVVWWAGALLRMQKDRNCWWGCGHHFQSGTWTLEGLFFSRTFLFLSKVLGGLFVTFSTCSNRCQPIPKISSCTWNTPLNFAWKCLASLTVFLDRKWHFSSLIPMFLSSSCSWLGQFHQESAQMCSTIQATPFEANPVLPESRSAQPAGKSAVICCHLPEITAGAVITPWHNVPDCQRDHSPGPLRLFSQELSWTLPTGWSVTRCHLAQPLLEGEQGMLSWLSAWIREKKQGGWSLSSLFPSLNTTQVFPLFSCLPSLFSPHRD